MCGEDGNLFTWEWDVDPLTREPIVPEWELLEIRDVLATYEEIVGHNIKFDLRALSKLYSPSVGRISWCWDKIHDTLIAAHCLCSIESHGLKRLALKYLDIPDDDELELRGAVNAARRLVSSKAFISKHGKWRIAGPSDPHWPAVTRPPKVGWWIMDTWLPKAVCKVKGYGKSHPWWSVLSKYGSRDAERTVLFWNACREEIKRMGLERQYETRRKLLEITYGMEDNGVSVHVDKIDSEVAGYEGTIRECEQECVELCGVPSLNVRSPKQLQDVLYNTFQLPVVKKTKTGASTDAEALDALQGLLEAEGSGRGPVWRFIDSLLTIRRSAKACDALRSYGLWSVNGRIHGSVNITGTRELRQSYSNPNLQNIGRGRDAD
jgi:DNA polymerase I-like protein with 3'-5' exonuclease and polymerase domains